MSNTMTPVWAQLVGDGERAEGFEQWMTGTLASYLKPEDLAGMPPADRLRAESRLRIGKIICAAVIEASRAEDRAGVDRTEILFDVTQFMVVALTSLISLTLKEDSHDEAVALLTAQFRENVMAHIRTIKP